MSASPVIRSGFWSAETVGEATAWTLPNLVGVADAPPHTADHFDELERTAYEDGFARGHAEGTAQGYADGAAKVREQAEQLRLLFEHFAKPLHDLDVEVERMLVALALDVGRRLAQATLLQSQDAVAGIIHEALGALAQPVRDARIHLHPADAELVREALKLPEDCTGWRLVPDRELMRGDCRVVTESAVVDARLDTREASVARSLLGDQP